MAARSILIAVGLVYWAGVATAQSPLVGPNGFPPHPSNPTGADAPTVLDVASLGPAGQEFGWYADVSVGLLKPRLATRLTTPGPLDPSFAGPTAPPTTALDWLAAPEIGLGYRFANAAGEVRLGYRLISSQGSGTEPGFDPTGDGSVRTRLYVNVIDADYVLPEFLTPEGVDTTRAFRREFKAAFGIRTATAAFDTRAVGPLTLESKASSFFAGLGPHAVWDFRQQIADQPAWVYARINVAGLWGGIQQKFTQTSLNPDGSTTTAAFDTRRLSTGVGVGGFEAGLSWDAPVGLRQLRLTAAYGWERWWNFGRTNDSNAELTLQGVILRAEYRY